MTHSSDELILIDFKHSLKTIPITNKTLFMTKMYHQTAKFINRMRWKVFFLDRDEATQPPDELANIYNSRRSAPESDKLKPFENDQYEIIINLKFSKIRSKYQNTLNKYIENLLSKKMVIVFFR